ncbi:coiled-coil domain-containing protein R3HCC1L [Bicyclus anynana]|uniref:Coiled-coil domain-containing protein R3HCC1L n=1 Tax=Bicyclus anynana TaxID=110368 RepID=A0A6J1NK35_BICAN|nr:coiled-coil domain-containing protein R3HCC1L [Bicyclus anynana]
MGLTQERNDADLTDNAAADCSAARAHATEKLRSVSGRPRRPDRAVYVPRALRAPEAEPARDKSAHGTPRRSLDKHFCNVYTPPPLRQPDAPAASPAPAPPAAPPAPTAPAAPAEPADESFYIGDYFAHSQLGFYRPSDGWPDMADSKDGDGEAAELERASREMSRGGKRIMKQSFESDVLHIADEPPRREDCDWDAVFDDDGECLDPSLLQQLSAAVGRVTVSRPRRAAPAPPPEPGDDALAHVLEVYDFPSEFNTNDLLALFSEYKETGFEIKWVDDTHALLVFSSAKIAAAALGSPRSLARVRPLHAATPESRGKARRCAASLQPYRQRPETCAALARRLVSGALGLRLSTAQAERAEERRLISRARERKRQAALLRQAAWDGSLANASPDA